MIDMHCHYVFRRAPAPAVGFAFEAPTDDPADPQHLGAAIAPRAERRLAFRMLRRTLGLPRDNSVIDEALARTHALHLGGDGPVTRFVLLAFDAYHDDAGARPPLPDRGSGCGSDMFTSNATVRAACAASDGRWLFGASVHPYRHDAEAALEEVVSAGACLLKLIPLHQNVSPHDARTERFFAKCRELDLPLLLHLGPEFTLRTNHPAYRPVAPFLELLTRMRQRGGMPKVIIAHLATPVGPWGSWRDYHVLIHALRHDFADAPLYADISALAAWGKLRSLRVVAARQGLHHKLLFGSDYPVPPAVPLLRWRFGRHLPAYASFAHISAAAFRCAGFNEIVFERAAEVLRL